LGLKFVHFNKNSSYHTGIKQPPYTALFGGQPRVGLRSAALPTEILERMVSEDDLFAVFNQNATTDVLSGDPGPSSVSNDVMISPPGPSTASNDVMISTPGPSTASNEVMISTPGPSTASNDVMISALGPSAASNDVMISAHGPSTAFIVPNQETSSALSMSYDQIQGQRKKARHSLTQQAERMVKRSRIVNSAGNPGDNVTVPIPLVDRGRGDPRNTMGIFLD
jgi:hypothetical protein